MESLSVALGERSYPIHIGTGLLDRRELYAPYLRGSAAIVTNKVVAPLYLQRVRKALGAARICEILVEDGEQAKDWATLDRVFDALLAARLGRDGLVVALGGGVVGDLAGFVAATYLRGLRLMQVPTSLVAQVDSALGGKVGVDLPAGKNLVGAFHQPALVLADVELLATLPDREWRAGLAEVIKHGVIRDRGLLDLLERRRPDILARDPGLVAGMVAQAAAVKVAVVVEDPLERGLRRILNYGHTLGHAIECAAGYGVVLHGEAVAWGMAAAARIAAQLGTCDGAFVAWQDALLRAYGLCMPLPVLQAEAVLQATRLDKKTAGGHLHWVLPRGPGEVTVTHDVPSVAVDAAVDWLVAEGR